MRKARLTAVASLCTGAVFNPRSHAAESYPTLPIRLIVPFPPGGSNGIIGRLLGQHVGDRPGT